MIYDVFECRKFIVLWKLIFDRCTDNDGIQNMISQYNIIFLDNSEIAKYLSIDN